MNPQKGRLFLIPAPLAPYAKILPSREDLSEELPARAIALMETLDNFVVESEKSAARLLSRVKDQAAMARLKMEVLDEHTPLSGLDRLLLPLLEGLDTGLLTEAGLPCAADPGGALVAKAHEASIPVVPVSGPSSLMLSLIASGCDAQRFSFLGYLPASKEERRRALLKISKDFSLDGVTRLWIETPYRNDALLADCVDCLPESARFCVAAALGTLQESIRSASIREWKKSLSKGPGKLPSVFVLGRTAGVAPKNTR